MAFRGRLVHIHNDSAALLLSEGNVIYGRRDFDANENRLSRAVVETNFSPMSGRLTVTIVHPHVPVPHHYHHNVFLISWAYDGIY